MNSITIIATTWFPKGPIGESRKEYAKEAILSWEEWLYYDGIINLHIADDGSFSDYLEDLVEFLSKWWTRGAVSRSRQERHGVGASLNAGIKVADKLFAYFVDDWKLTGEMDLTPWATLLLREERVGMVRLGPPHPYIAGKVEMFNEGWALVLERHHFAFGHRPALYHKRMIEAYGYFEEDVNALECERSYNLRFCSYEVPGYEAGPKIIYALPSPFEHIAEDVHVSEVDPSEAHRLPIDI